MRSVYFDHAAGTPVHPRVVEAMLPYLREVFGNPSSTHSFGQAAHQAVDRARGQVAELIGASSEEIYFTASGSESNNFALKGMALAAQQLGRGKHLIVSQIEHHSVLHSAQFLERQGYEVTYLPVDRYGLVDPDDVAAAMRDDTFLVSIMHANNEIGTIEPMAEIGRITRQRDVVFHSDAVQTVGVVPVDVEELGVDLLSLAGNMFYGPKGVAALYIRSGVRIMPFIDGGIQERGRRAGTENVPGIVGLGVAAELARQEIDERRRRIVPLRDRLIQGLLGSIERIYLNGHPTERLPGNAHFSLEYVEGEAVIVALDMQGVAAASGSACTSLALKSSHVLEAIGLSQELAQGSLLFTLGKDNTEEEVDYVLEVLPPIVARLRQISPLYSK
ncbi:MAG: cysteine desulfurase NifS [Anaerolineae bacterium]